MMTKKLISLFTTWKTETGFIFVILAALIALLIKGNALNTDEHLYISNTLIQINEQNSKLNEEIVATSVGMHSNYDTIVLRKNNLQRLSKSLYSKLHAMEIDNFESYWSDLLDVYAKKDILIEDFKSHYAVLSISLNYLPLAINKFIAEKAHNSEEQKIFNTLNTLLTNIYIYYANGAIANENHIISTIASTRNSSSIFKKDQRVQLELILKHCEAVVRFKKLNNENLHKIHITSIDPAINALTSAYNKHHEKLVAETRNARIALFCVSTILLIIVAYVLIRLSLLTRKLTDTNRELSFHKFAIDEHAIVSITDVKGNITYVNNKFCEISGYSANELIGMNHRIVKSDEHSEALFKDMYRTIASGKTWHANIKNRRKNGDYYWVSSTMVPLLNEKGKACRYISIRTDITHIKHMEQELDKGRKFLQSITNTMAEGVFAQDKNGLCVFVNKEATDLLGRSEQELLGKNILELIRHNDSPQDSNNSESSLLNNVHEDKIYRTDENIFKRKDGSLFYASTTSAALKIDDNITGSVTVFEDITERKENQNNLEKALQEAENANLMKSYFMANMSHEIRTPMNAIIGFSQLALMGDKDNPLYDYMNDIHNSSKHLMAIINDILDFTTIEAGILKLELTSFSLNEIMQQITAIINPNVIEKDIKLLIDIKNDVPDQLLGDPIRIKKILLNLTSNAIKFTSVGEINISVNIISNVNDLLEIYFSVRDTGIGLTAEEQALLFQPFTQVDASPTRKYEGTGLGLAISKQLVTMMNGVIGVDSEQGKGSNFWFILKMHADKI